MTDVIEFLYESQCNEEPESIPELGNSTNKSARFSTKSTPPSA